MTIVLFGMFVAAKLEATFRGMIPPIRLTSVSFTDPIQSL